MALNTYTALVASVSTWLARTDVASRAPDFVALAHVQLGRKLRVRAMEERANMVVEAEYATLPEDFVGVKAIELDPVDSTDKRATVDFLDPLDFTRAKIDGGEETGKPTHFTIIGSELRFNPVPVLQYTARMVFYAAIPALSEASPINWLLVRHCDAYLYGALLQSAPYLQHDERIATWAKLYSAAINDIQEEDAAEQGMAKATNRFAGRRSDVGMIIRQPGIYL